MTRQRVIRVTGTIDCRSGILVVSRPASTVARARIRRLFRVVHSLGTHKITVICVARGVGRLFRVTSRFSIFHSNGCINARTDASIAHSSVVQVVIKHRVASVFPGRGTSVNSIVLSIRGLALPNAFRGVAFSLQENRVLKLTNLINSNQSGITRTLFKMAPTGRNVVRVSKHGITVGSPISTVHRNVTLLARSHGTAKYFLPLSVVRGVRITTLRSSRIGLNCISRHKLAGLYRRVGNGLQVGAPAIRRQVRGLSNNGRRGILVTH